MKSWCLVNIETGQIIGEFSTKKAATIELKKIQNVVKKLNKAEFDDNS